MVTALWVLSITVVVYAVALTFIVMRKQKNKEFDKGMSLTTVKHPFIANPAIIAYALTPIIVIIAVIIWMMISGV